MIEKDEQSDDNLPNGKKSKANAFLYAFGLYGGAGFMLVFSLLGGLFLGQYLDKTLETEPVFLLVGIIFGGAAGFYNLYRLVTYKKKKKE